MCTLYDVGTLLPPVAEICARLAGNFCQLLTTVKSGANGMVWLNVLYFTASQQGGGREGELGNHSPYQNTTRTWLMKRGREGVNVPSSWVSDPIGTAHFAEVSITEIRIRSLFCYKFLFKKRSY